MELFEQDFSWSPQYRQKLMPFPRGFYSRKLEIPQHDRKGIVLHCFILFYICGIVVGRERSKSCLPLSISVLMKI